MPMYFGPKRMNARQVAPGFLRYWAKNLSAEKNSAFLVFDGGSSSWLVKGSQCPPRDLATSPASLNAGRARRCTPVLSRLDAANFEAHWLSLCFRPAKGQPGLNGAEILRVSNPETNATRLSLSTALAAPGRGQPCRAWQMHRSNVFPLRQNHGPINHLPPQVLARLRGRPVRKLS
jgi:hypothetical protein